MNKIVKKLMVVAKMVGESTSFAISSLKNDKFRTFLSLLGVSIGIFSIVAVFCAVDALQSNVREGLDTFGGDVIYIQKFPWEIEDAANFKWWEIFSRPNPSEKEFLFIKNNSKLSEQVVFMRISYKWFKRERFSFPEGAVIASSEGLNKVSTYDISEGRNFSSTEFNSAMRIAVIGAVVSDKLFPEGDPVGKEISIGGAKAKIIGVVKKQGESLANIFDTDNSVIVPLNFGKNISGMDDSYIILSPKEGVDKEEFKAETKMLLRSHRRLKPSQNDNFAINEMTFLKKSVASMMGVVNIVGWVIGGFSLLIGGFGIANIMFVSVKERTNQIGIQKALGAKRYIILTQFLVESGVLSLLGGILGIMMVYAATFFVKDFESFKIVLTMSNAIKGLIISLVIGILSGFIPAYVASKMDPVIAINS